MPEPVQKYYVNVREFIIQQFLDKYNKETKTNVNSIV